MPVKMTGAQYKAFLASDWGPDAMWEETEIHRNGSELDSEIDSDADQIADTDEITIVLGTIIPDQRVPPSQTEYVDAVKFARKWLKAQTTVTLMVDVPRARADAYVTLIEGLGAEGEKARIIGRVG